MTQEEKGQLSKMTGKILDGKTGLQICTEVVCKTVDSIPGMSSMSWDIIKQWLSWAPEKHGQPVDVEWFLKFLPVCEQIGKGAPAPLTKHPGKAVRVAG